ncbi:helix-turn-helix transcriptional regulator [Methylobacterium brachythecii]|uniref:DNA-binding CsgD family transcriptional regulator n=1 Tax=Methylobacterium brachythecii TaxID=1176177 RepID=A0A7W6AKS0_9HYPH|nr:helix-turn-helix transcriptional regulator [Methylobacterium brachythecii]MBB3905273.1 DNA-binding CsgD family transcriptional regulator [Methylobacterium brachythecii]GLS45954.1 LuxR family transcriptional regulator [Methylobacterium brachythecii]
MARHTLRDAIEDVGQLIDEAAFDVGRWQDVLDTLTHSLPGTRANLQVVDPALGRAAPMVGSGWRADEMDAYARHFGAINPWVSVLLRSSPMAAICGERELPYSELRKSEFYQDWLRPIGEVDGSSGIKLLDSGGRFGALTLSYDVKRTDRIYPDIARLLQALAPRIERSLNISRVGVGASWRAEGTSLVGAIADPALVVTWDGRLLDANTPGSDLMLSGAAFRLGAADRLRLKDARMTARFQAALRAACQGRQSPEPAGGLRFSTLAGDFALTIVSLRPDLTRMRGLTPWLAAGEIALVVLKRCGSRRRADAAEILSQRHRLSPAEVRLVLAMDGKRALPEVAADLAISYETARWHLKRIFAKLGISRQAELVAMAIELKGSASEV